MNNATIAALYPYFVDSLRYANSAQAMESLLVRRFQAEAAQGSRRCQIALTDVDHPGQPADWLAEVAGYTLLEYAPERVFDWVRQHLPTWAEDYQQKPATGWQVYLQAKGREQAAGTGLHLYATATSAELAPVLRGLRAHQAKRRKLARRLLAQLRAYHAQQQAAEALRATMQAAASAGPLLPTYGIPYAEYWNRIEAAEETAEQKKENHGREILWHPDFAVGCVQSFSCMPLHEVEPFFGGNLAQTLNVGRPLDRADYLYLADCLREGVADNPTPLAALRLARALAWVEQAAEALLPTAQPHLTAAPFEAAPALAA